MIISFYNSNNILIFQEKKSYLIKTHKEIVCRLFSKNVNDFFIVVFNSRRLTHFVTNQWLLYANRKKIHFNVLYVCLSDQKNTLHLKVLVYECFRSMGLPQVLIKIK